MNIKTTIISVDQAIADGGYTWSKSENDIDYKGWIPGYSVGFCVEIKRPDGSLGYSSCTFLDWEEEVHAMICEEDRWNALGNMAEMCEHDGNVVTGRIVFRGYFNDHYDASEREEYYTDASNEVLELLTKYHVEEVE